MLRERLQQITRDRDLDQHAASIQALNQEFPHSIEVLESTAFIGLYTCGVFAFHLVGVTAYAQIAIAGAEGAFAGIEFFKFAIASDQLAPREIADAQPDDIMFYLNEGGEPQHVGRLVNRDRVRSKWGTGNLYEHGIWEVPIEYGEQLLLFQDLGPDDCLDLFFDFAEGLGVEFLTE